jgi:hypothetical protein
MTVNSTRRGVIWMRKPITCFSEQTEGRYNRTQRVDMKSQNQGVYYFRYFVKGTKIRSIRMLKYQLPGRSPLKTTRKTRPFCKIVFKPRERFSSRVVCCTQCFCTENKAANTLHPLTMGKFTNVRFRLMIKLTL